jgi:hypothetical protein
VLSNNEFKMIGIVYVVNVITALLLIITEF